MKLKSLWLALAATSVLASCSHVSKTTIIKGSAPTADQVQITLNFNEVLLDTTIAVADGKFTFETPTEPMHFGMISDGMNRLTFIPDGTELEVVLSDSSYIRSNHEGPQSAFNDYQDKFSASQREMREEYARIAADSTLTNEKKTETFHLFYEEKQAEFIDYNREFIKANSQNFAGLNALSNIHYELEPQEVSELIALLSDHAKEHKFIISLQESLEAKLATAEGSMFTDFEVQTVIGHDRSMKANPIYKSVKFSDYIGKGKYVLVDFWSPWCGPCKREMPNIKAVYDKWHGDEFDVLSIAVWEREDVRVTMNTAAELGVTWNQINNAQDIPTKLYGIDGIPHIILFGPDGTILKRGIHGQQIEETVAGYLK